jgi:hypothetical protein
VCSVDKRFYDHLTTTWYRMALRPTACGSREEHIGHTGISCVPIIIMCYRFVCRPSTTRTCCTTFVRTYMGSFGLRYARSIDLITTCPLLSRVRAPKPRRNMQILAKPSDPAMRVAMASMIEVTPSFAAEISFALREARTQQMMTSYMVFPNSQMEDSVGHPESDDDTGEDLFTLNWPDVQDIVIAASTDGIANWPDVGDIVHAATTEVIEIDD